MMLINTNGLDETLAFILKFLLITIKYQSKYTFVEMMHGTQLHDRLYFHARQKLLPAAASLSLSYPLLESLHGPKHFRPIQTVVLPRPLVLFSPDRPRYLLSHPCF